MNPIENIKIVDKISFQTNIDEQDEEIYNEIINDELLPDNMFNYIKNWSDCVNVLSDTFEKYKDNSYILNRLINYVSNIPNVIERMIKEKEARDKQRERLNREKDIFTNKFLQTHNYSYLPSTEFFFSYNGMHYNIYNEDDIQHEIL